MASDGGRLCDRPRLFSPGEEEWHVVETAHRSGALKHTHRTPPHGCVCPCLYGGSAADKLERFDTRREILLPHLRVLAGVELPRYPCVELGPRLRCRHYFSGEQRRLHRWRDGECRRSRRRQTAIGCVQLSRVLQLDHDGLLLCYDWHGSQQQRGNKSVKNDPVHVHLWCLPSGEYYTKNEARKQYYGIKLCTRGGTRTLTPKGHQFLRLTCLPFQHSGYQ